MSLSLWQIDSDLEAMIEVRAELLNCDPPEDTAAIDEVIAVYLTEKLPQKVDAIAGQLRKWKAEAEAAKAEAKRVKEVAEAIEARAERLKSICIQIIQQCPVAKISKTGSVSLAGASSVLRVQTSGGPQALSVYDPSLLPIDYKTIVVRMTPEQFQRIGSGSAFPQFSTEPDTYAIRKALSTTCNYCGGSGDCHQCGDTGRHIVPGAKLEPRGSHLRVDSR